TAISTTAISALASSTETTTSWVGGIGVMPVRTRKVTSADRSASTTAVGANHEVHERGGRGNGGAAPVASRFALDSAKDPVICPVAAARPVAAVVLRAAMMPCDNTGAKM